MSRVGHKKVLPEYKVTEILDNLLNKAREKDEFEYVSTLLRIRGMEDAGWDPLVESNVLINQMVTQIQAPLEDSFRLRLTLFLYCHSTEMHDLYHVVGNMLRVILGKRYSLAPFIANPGEKIRAAKYPTEKAERIAEWSQTAGIPEVGELFKDALIKEVRNAFFHSDYILYGDSFRIRHGDGVKIGNEIDRRVRLEWLVPRLDLGINIALAFIDVTLKHIRSYKQNKIVMGQIQGPIPVEVELTVDPKHGLTGFKCPPERHPNEATIIVQGSQNSD